MQILAINWAEVGVQVVHLILALSILVILHEFGHYITARWFGCRVEKFYLFFDPWFSLFKKKVGDTEYGIGWLPLGGYVKIAGMVDESMDTEALKQPPKDYEFRSKPAWQRLIIMLGGIIMNILVAIIIYSFSLLTWGEDKVPLSSMKYGVHVGDSTLLKYGFRTGDKLLSVDNAPMYDLRKFTKKLLTAKSVQIERNGETVNLNLPEDFVGQLIENKNKRKLGFLTERIPVLVDSVSDTSKAYKAGLRAGDYIVGIDSMQFQFFDEMKGILEGKKNKNVLLTVQRGDQVESFMTPINADGVIGFHAVANKKKMDSLGWLKIEHTDYTWANFIPAGIKKSYTELRDYIEQFGVTFNFKTGGYKGIGGFKSMGSIMPSQFGDWQFFWNITAFISLALAFMNLLPIPALDGGHVMFTLYEMITGRKPNEKFLEYAQMAGMIILLGFMLYANGNDWFGWAK